jgi:hypothetical protein
VLGYSTVRSRLHVCEGRADDADVADAAVGDTHDDTTIGLYATRRASSRRRPPTYPAVPQCAVSTVPRCSTVGYFRVLPTHAVRGTAGCVSGAEPSDGSQGEWVFQKGTKQCARTVMFVRVEPTTLTWPVVPPSRIPSIPLVPERPTSPPSRLACIPNAAQARAGVHQLEGTRRCPSAS